LIAMPRPMPAASRRYLIVVRRPLPTVPLAERHRYLIESPGLCPRRRSLCVAGTWPWCPGRCRRWRSLCVAGIWPFIVVNRPLPAAPLA
jgi:hypothetical protein